MPKSPKEYATDYERWIGGDLWQGLMFCDRHIKDEDNAKECAAVAKIFRDHGIPIRRTTIPSSGLRGYPARPMIMIPASWPATPEEEALLNSATHAVDVFLATGI